MAAREAPRRRPTRPELRKRNLRIALGPDLLKRLVVDCARGESQAAVAQRYAIAQSSVSKYVRANAEESVCTEGQLRAQPVPHNKRCRAQPQLEA